MCRLLQHFGPTTLHFPSLMYPHLFEPLQTTTAAECFVIILQLQRERFAAAHRAAVLTDAHVVLAEIIEACVAAKPDDCLIQGQLTFGLKSVRKEPWT